MSQFLLLQIRDHDDPMRMQEVACFARALHCGVHDIATHNLLSGSPKPESIARSGIVLIGGSNYSVTAPRDWLEQAFETLRGLVASATPTFASCWGCQAFAQALGGSVVTDEARAELGMHEVTLTESGKKDPLFCDLPESLLAPMGHQDYVAQLPLDAILLGSTRKVANQAFRFKKGKPIYCTQFHPELDRNSILERIAAYPHYLESITGQTFDEFARACPESTGSNQLLRRFVASLN